MHISVENVIKIAIILGCGVIMIAFGLGYTKSNDEMIQTNTDSAWSQSIK